MTPLDIYDKIDFIDDHVRNYMENEENERPNYSHMSDLVDPDGTFSPYDDPEQLWLDYMEQEYSKLLKDPDLSYYFELRDFEDYISDLKDAL